jgi:transcriptional regulatory protein RtcR
LICGSNRDLPAAVAQGRFRDDLLARINLWTFDLPSLKDRNEDIEPNIQYELSRYENTTGNHVSFNKEAKGRFLSFASSRQAVWKANFRDLIGSVTRMATLAPGGRITVQIVEDEIKRLTESWQDRHADHDTGLLTAVLGREKTDSLDEFEKTQLAAVLRICRKSKSLSDAGRQLFAVSRQKRTQANDADRLRKYLARFGITWNDLDQ